MTTPRAAPIFAAVVSLTRGRTVEVSKELVRAVYEMDVHGGKSASWRTDATGVVADQAGRAESKGSGPGAATANPPYEHPLVVPQLPQT